MRIPPGPRASLVLGKITGRHLDSLLVDVAAPWCLSSCSGVLEVLEIECQQSQKEIAGRCAQYARLRCFLPSQTLPSSPLPSYPLLSYRIRREWSWNVRRMVVERSWNG